MISTITPVVALVRERSAVQTVVDRVTKEAGLAGRPRQVLFSTRRFKQTAGRYFGQAVS